MQMAATPCRIQPRVATQLLRAEVTIHVARLIESETANRIPHRTNMLEPWPGYRAGFAASQGRMYTGGGWCCPGSGTASESTSQAGWLVRRLRPGPRM